MWCRYARLVRLEQRGQMDLGSNSTLYVVCPCPAFGTLLPSPHLLAPLPPLLLAAIQYVLAIAGRVEGILEGSPLIDPMQYGWTTEEERSAATGGNVSSCGPKRAVGRPGCRPQTECCRLGVVHSCFLPAHLPTPLPASYCAQWPGVTATVKPANAGLRLFGGAAFERVLQVWGRVCEQAGRACR